MVFPYVDVRESCHHEAKILASGNVGGAISRHSQPEKLRLGTHISHTSLENHALKTVLERLYFFAFQSVEYFTKNP
ncbi:hypothetical protein [Rhodanobacter sp. 115]|uniref:hypothetical protein n=1 Tax=Rhodanobacter sp. FW021-MT20 TaxID=1162282 RepID=UPI0012F74ECC|nr:hypothetical protein [Rhodanobacter sp. 115]